jgi:hypothetical protein
MAEFERRLRELEQEVEAGRPEKPAKPDPDAEPPGLLTLGGAEFFIEGKAEVLFIDSQNESDPVLGETEEPHPHLEIERLRLEPRLDVGRGLLLRGQIDFKPDDAQTVLKEVALEHDAEIFPWLASDLRIGLQDRFFRPSRPLKNYPLVGNALWRDETSSIIWRLSFGDEQVGAPAALIAPAVAVEAPAEPLEEPTAEPPAPAEEGGKKKKKKKKAKDAPPKSGTEPPAEPGTAATPAAEPAAAPPPAAPLGPAILAGLGRFDLYASLGNGPQLDTNEVGFDRAAFNDLVQDDRNVTGDLALRELGVGLGYRRASDWGELEALGFYVNDRLSDESVDFLTQELTVRDVVTGAPVAGYGDSDSRQSQRYGATLEYWLPATAIWGADAAVKRRDGLRLQGQWLRADDGDLRRTGWSAHAGYRWSFPQPLLFGRYFRHVEPIVAYGDLRTNLVTSPLLPGTWDRRQVLLGVLIEVTGNVLIDIEYSFQLEKTGGSSVGAPDSVDNNELLVELVVTF